MRDDDTTARRLGRALAQVLTGTETAEDDGAARVLRQRVLATPSPPSRAQWLRPLVAAAALLALVTAAWLGSRRPPPATLQAFIDGSGALPAASFVYAPPERSLGLRFSDGTRVDVAPGSGVRLLALEDAGAQIALEFGRLHANVRHRAGARWRVTAGPFAVDVIGTEFDVELEPSTQRLAVRVQSGVVRVSGAGLAPRAVVAGGAFSAQGFERPREELRGPVAGSSGASAPTALARGSAVEPLASASAAEPSSQSRPPGAADASRPGHVRIERAPSPPTASAPPVGASPSEQRWRALANARRFRESMEAARAEGISNLLGTAGAADLLLLANTARLAGDWQPAEEAFTTLRRRFPSEPSRGRAAFWLGTIAFDRKADLSTAQRWFSTYLREEPDGELAREARGRTLEILAKLGERAEGRGAAEDYLRRYPQGPHEALARSMLSD